MQAGKDVMAELQLQQTVHQMLTQAMDMFEQEYFKSGSQKGPQACR